MDFQRFDRKGETTTMIKIVIYAEQYADVALKVDAALINSKEYYRNLMKSAGFFKKFKIISEQREVTEQLVELKAALVCNPESSLIIDSKCAFTINKLASSKTIVDISNYHVTNEDNDDGLFDFNPRKGDDSE